MQDHGGVYLINLLLFEFSGVFKWKLKKVLLFYFMFMFKSTKEPSCSDDLRLGQLAQLEN